MNSSGGTTLVATLGATATSDTVTGQTPGAKESFKVEAFNTTSIADSAVVSVTMPTPPPPPPTTTLKAPTVTVSNVTTTTAVLSWNSVSGAQGYRIYWINGSNQRILLGTVSASTTAAEIVNMTAGRTFKFIVEAFSGSVFADSTTVSITTSASSQHH